MKIAIIAPTRNEESNIELFLKKLIFELSLIKEHEFLIIIPDKSDDKTIEKLAYLSKKHKNLIPLWLDKTGLGHAYIKGFSVAIENKAEIIIQIDADLSHPPASIHALIKEIMHGCDVAIASRYIKGGSTPGWAIGRKIVTFAGNLVFRPVSGLFKVNDCTSGFRAIRTKILKKTGFEKISAKGYAFQAELLYRLSKAGAKIKEVPLISNERKSGKTKHKSTDIIEFLIKGIVIGTDRYNRFITFLTIGIISSIFDLGLLFFLVEHFRLGKTFIAPSVALETTIFLSFFLNSRFTFKDSRKENFFYRFGKFHLAALSGFTLNLIIYNLFLKYANLSFFVGKYDYILSQILTMCIVTFWNFYINYAWTWKIPSKKG